MICMLQKPTRIMMRMADTPDVAMTLAQLGMRLKRTGTMASAPWSNLFPSNVERWLQVQENSRVINRSDAISAEEKKKSQHSRHGNASLADHLRAQVFSRQLEGSIEQSQVLEEAVVGGSTRHQKRADLLELLGIKEEK